MALAEARRVLRARIAANGVRDDEGNWLDGQDEAAISQSDAYDPQLERLLSAADNKADFELLGYITVGRISLWEAEGKEWRLIPPQWGSSQIARRTEKVVGFFVDQREFEATVLAAHSVTEKPQVADTTSPKAPSPKRPRGRPDGKKYAKSDAILVAKMRDLRQSGKASSPTDAANQVAPEAEGATEASKARRLYKAYRATFGWEEKGV